MYEESVEEQRYEAAISREKKAFENLISFKAHMVIPVDISASTAKEAMLTMSDKERGSLVSPYALAQYDSRLGAPLLDIGLLIARCYYYFC